MTPPPSAKNLLLIGASRGLGLALAGEYLERGWQVVANEARTLLLMAPGWVRTDMGGPQGRLSIEESIPNLADTMDAQAGKGGLQYLDYLGRVVPW